MVLRFGRGLVSALSLAFAVAAGSPAVAGGGSWDPDGAAWETPSRPVRAVIGGGVMGDGNWVAGADLVPVEARAVGDRDGAPLYEVILPLRFYEGAAAGGLVLKRGGLGVGGMVGGGGASAVLLLGAPGSRFRVEVTGGAVNGAALTVRF